MIELFQYSITCLILFSLRNFSCDAKTLFFGDAVSTKTYMFWENATIPFYINPDHFDYEQSMAIMTALSMFAFKTCLKFAPVMTAPQGDQHVLVFVNPDGTRRCVIDTAGHSVFEPHTVTLGYECLQSPAVDMMIMKALGFPFEHNRLSRDLFIEVLLQNIEPDAVQLFAKDAALPKEMQSLPYDIDSAMHFGEREYTRNGHRTIMFKDRKLHQNRVGLSPTDLRKIEIVYGPECLKRDRQEKIEMCQAYPGVARRKREVDDLQVKSLRVNPDITAPPQTENSGKKDEDKANNNENVEMNDEANHSSTEDFSESIKELGIGDEVQVVMEHVHKVSSLALKNARNKYCNISKAELRSDSKDSTDLLGVLEVIADYAKSVVDNAVANLTTFCLASESIESYQRQRCNWNSGSDRCRQTYRSTKSGMVKYSTQHRPVYYQSTNHNPLKRHQYGLRAHEDDDGTADTTEAQNASNTPQNRRKRSAEVTTEVNETPDIFTNTTMSVTDIRDAANNEAKEMLRMKTSVGFRKVYREDDGMSQNHRFRSTNQNNKDIWGESNLSFANRQRQIKGFTDENGNTHVRLELPSQNVENRPRKLRKKKQIEPDGTLQGFDEDLKGDEVKEKDETRNRYLILKKRDQSRETDDIWRDDKKTNTHETRERHKIRDRYKIKNRDENRGIYESKDDDKTRYRDKESRNMEQSDEITERDDTRGRYESRDRDETRGRYEIRDRDETGGRHEVMERDKPKAVKAKRPRPDETLGSQKQRKDKRPRLATNSNTGVPQVVSLTKLNEEFYGERKWPTRVVPYVLPESERFDIDDARKRLGEVNRILRRKTCVTIMEVTEDSAKDFEDYLVLDASPDYVTGRVGGRQNFGCIELLQGYQHRQHAAMMVMAMLGFYFEVSRHDRDKYIRVHVRHIRPDKLHHFEKIREEATLNVPYDYYSATHPAWQFWRKIGKTGISTVATFKEHDPDGSIMKSLGQNAQLLSDIDIIKINSVYGVDCYKSEKASNDRSAVEDHTQGLK